MNIFLVPWWFTISDPDCTFILRPPSSAKFNAASRFYRSSGWRMRCVKVRIVLECIANRVYFQSYVPLIACPVNRVLRRSCVPTVKRTVFECVTVVCTAVESTIAEFMTVKCTTIQFKIAECTESRVNRSRVDRESNVPSFNSSESMCRVKITDNKTRACN